MTLPEAVQLVAKAIETSNDAQEIQALANLGNYLWFRLQQRSAKSINEPLSERKHEAECVRYKGLLPKEWQW